MGVIGLPLSSSIAELKGKFGAGGTPPLPLRINPDCPVAAQASSATDSAETTLLDNSAVS